jgi:biopolymer transport protein ExbD
MRRFSQRNALVTLSDINITPLLDLAFVLLIIFVITTPLLENSMDLRLPEGGRAPTQRVDRDNLRNVEVNRQGQYLLGTNVCTIDQLEQTLVREYRANPELVIRIRADQESLARHFYPVIDRLTRNGITRLSLATEPAARR